MLEHEEYIEQAYFFQAMGERMSAGLPLQDLLETVRDELLATTQLPMAISFLRSELLHTGRLSSAMHRLPHYFTSFQTYLMTEAEDEQGRFDMQIALKILQAEAIYRSEGTLPQGGFLFQLETVCRNRLRYDPGLRAIAEDPLYDESWKDWVLTLRRRIDSVELADIVYVHSQHYANEQQRKGNQPPPLDHILLFGEKEGRIALANRHKNPLLFFKALQRHLGYPEVPRPMPLDDSVELLPQILRQMERLEGRLKLIEDEQRGGIDLSKLYGPPPEER